MSIVINRSTLQLMQSAHTPDYPDKDWIINPVLPLCPARYWEISGDDVLEMGQAQKDAVDTALSDAAATATAEATRNELIRLRSLKLGEDKLIEEEVIQPKAL